MILQCVADGTELAGHKSVSLPSAKDGGYDRPVQREEEGSFHWSEDFNEPLNYWFWLRRLGKLTEEALTDHARRTLGLPVFSAYVEVSEQTQFEEFHGVWRHWKLDQTTALITAGRARAPKDAKAHYQEMAAVAPRPFTIQWVMAPFGERWVFRPDVVVLGSEGGDPGARRQAVLEAARPLPAAG